MQRSLSNKKKYIMSIQSNLTYFICLGLVRYCTVTKQNPVLWGAVRSAQNCGVIPTGSVPANIATCS